MPNPYTSKFIDAGGVLRDVSSATPFPVTGGAGGGTSTPTQVGAYTDRSGTITTGGTAQQLMAANASRKYLYIENPKYLTGGAANVNTLWFNIGSTAAVGGAGNIHLDPGDTYEVTSTVSSQALSIIGSTTGQPFTAKEL